MKMYTVADVADMLCLSQEKVRRLIRSGELTAIKIPNNTYNGSRAPWRVRDIDLENFYNNNLVYA